MKKSSPKIIKMKKNKLDQLLAKLAVFISLLMIVGGTIGMILVQREIRKPQDLRQQASVDNGQITVSMGSTDLSPNQPGKITFYVDTAGVQTDGVQLTFNVVTDTLSTPPSFSILDSVPLQLAYSEVETTTDGYLVSMIALPQQIGQPFSAATSIPFASLDINPNKTGTISLNFDVENSISTVHASNPPTDELTHIATSTFSVLSPVITPECLVDTDCASGEICSQSDKVCLVPDPTPTVSPSPNTSPTPTLTPSPTITLQPTPSPSPTADSGIGGNPNIATCNESCAVNADCDVNLRCYSGQCRLVTNVSSTTCSSPDDLGLNFSCNEYCADTNECASGLICQNNKCRNPENVNSTSCAALTVAQRNEINKSCNESCSTNSECATNLQCYQGSCRLATNPGSYSCSASTKKTVSTPVYGGTSKPKGETTTETATAITSNNVGGKKDPVGTSNNAVTTNSDSRDLTNPAGTDNLSNSDNNNQQEDQTALDSVKSYLLANPKLPITLMGIGLGLIIALLLLALLKKRKDDDEPPMATPGAMGTKSTYQDSLQDKINTLKKDSFNRPSSNIRPPMMTPPPMSGIDRAKLAQNYPTNTDSREVFSSNNKASSMMDRLKTKDITPPSV